MVAGKRSYNGGMGKLLLLFIIVPAVELGLLIQAGIYLGTWPTLALIVFTGIVGAYLARRQGSRFGPALRSRWTVASSPRARSRTAS